MSEDSIPAQNSSQEPAGSAGACPGAATRGQSALRGFALATVFALVVGGAWCAWRFVDSHRVDGAGEAGRLVTESRLQEAVAPLAARVDSLERLSQQVATSAEGGAVDATERGEGRTDARKSAVLKEELAQSRKDILALTAEIKALKDNLRQTGDLASRSQREFKNLTSAAMALAHLRARASAGYSFSRELAAYRSSGISRDGVQAALAELDRHAAHGAPALEALRRQLAELSGSVEGAVERAHAQGWRQRVLAALQGLVSIRSERGGVVSGALERADAALTEGDAVRALAEVSALESAAQDVLQEWRRRLEARVAVDQAIEDLITLSFGAAPHTVSGAISETNAAGAPTRGQDKSSDGEADESAEQP